MTGDIPPIGRSIEPAIESREEMEAHRFSLIVENERLELEIINLRLRCANQRRELRRLNKQGQPWWKGFASGLRTADEARLRGIMNKAFGWERVREAELAALNAAHKDGK
jgi:regulator of replication initiation timing